MRILRRRLDTRDERGFGLVEMLIAAAVLIVITGSTLGILDSAVKTERTQQARTATLDDLRLTMNRITKEVRQASSVDEASTTTRIDMRTYVNGVEREIVYELSDGTVTRSLDGGAAVPLVDGVVGTTPFCYDPPTCSAVTPTTAPSVVQVTLSVQPDASDAQPLTLETEVKLRNVSTA